MRDFTTQQIAALAPDTASLKAGQGLATPRKWPLLGHSERALWGHCQGSGKTPYETGIDLSGPHFKCSCPSRKFPCKHGLGLFLLYVAQTSAFAATEPPAWVAEWLAKRVQTAQRKVAAAQPAATPEEQARREAAQAKRAASRESKVAEGVAELDLWLKDMVRQGLAAVQGRPARFYEGMAARLVDAQAPGLARQVRALSSQAASGEGWAGRLLAGLGQLRLTLEGYRRLNTLPANVQADVRAAVGWTVKEDELIANGPARQDRWLVLGQRIYDDDKLRVRHTWLRGAASGSDALLLDFVHGQQPFAQQLFVGMTLDAALVFYPGRSFRAALREQRDYQLQADVSSLKGYADSVAFLSAYVGAWARYPWLTEFPALITETVPVQRDGAWRLRTKDARLLPLAPRFDQGWQLLALSGGHPLTVFGEWNGRQLLPLTAWSDRRLEFRF